MFRLTLVLLAGLYAIMVIWGEPVRDVAVTRDDATPTTMPTLAAAVAGTRQPQDDPGLSDVSAEEAVELALAAGEQEAPAPEAAAAAAKPAPEPEVWYVTGSRVNLRGGPSTDAAIVGAVSLGDPAELLSDPAEPWTRIRTERGLEAWIFSRFISETPA